MQETWKLCVSVRLMDAMQKRLSCTYATLWNSSQIKRHLGSTSVSLFQKRRDT